MYRTMCAVVIAVTLVLTGCASTGSSSSLDAKTEQLAVGMSKSKVETILGKPSQRSRSADGTETWSYTEASMASKIGKAGKLTNMIGGAVLSAVPYGGGSVGSAVAVAHAGNVAGQVGSAADIAEKTKAAAVVIFDGNGKVKDYTVTSY